MSGLVPQQHSTQIVYAHRFGSQKAATLQETIIIFIAYAATRAPPGPLVQAPPLNFNVEQAGLASCAVEQCVNSKCPILYLVL